MIAPLPGTLGEIRKRNLVDNILDECWKNPNAGYQVQPTDEWIVNNQQLDGEDPFDILERDKFDGNTYNDESIDTDSRWKPSTYGEITPLGARQLFVAMELTDSSPVNNEGSSGQGPAHFFDLGSGTGKLVGQVVLELPHEIVGKATGIELSPSRHESAIRAREALFQWPRRSNNAADLSDMIQMDSEDGDNSYDFSVSEESIIRSTNKLELLEGDLFDVDLSTATHVYVASLCFPENLMLRLENRLQLLLQQQQRQKGSASQKARGDNARNESSRHQNGSVLKCVATLQPFPNNLGGIRPVIRFMEMSWTKPLGCAVYLYRFN